MFTSFTPVFSGDEPEEDGKNGIWEKIPFHGELTEFWRRQIYCRVWRFAWSHQAELRDLKIVHEALGFMRKAAAAESYSLMKAKLEGFTKTAEKYDFYDRVRFSRIQVAGAYAKSVVKAMKAETDRSLTICAIALKRYSLRYGKLPENLDALTPEFLSAAPLDYMDGKPMRYRINGDGTFTLYSVGEDGKDDGGDLTPPEGSKSKDLWRRRDYVWPAPATPEEVEIYRQRAGRD